MKKIPSWIILLGCEVVGLLLIFAFGFKFTYAPELENSWAAISAFAAWAGVLASSIAIYVAIQIPKKIAERQDKVALFEKRFELYNTLYKCRNFSVDLSKNENSFKVFASFLGVLDHQFAVNYSDRDLVEKIIPVLGKTITVLRQGKFLFDFDLDKELNVIADSLLDIMVIYDNSTVLHAKCDAFSKVMAEQSVIERIEKTLKL